MKWRGFILVLMVAAAGCENDPVDPEPLTARIVVTELSTNAPIAGVKFIAMDRRTNTVAAGPYRTDAEGKIDFGTMPSPEHYYLAFGTLQWQMHDQTAYDTSNAGWIKTSPPPFWTHPRRITMRPAPPTDGLPRIAGRVIDSATGGPLEQVFIGTTPWLTAFNDENDPGDDVTTADGTFAVHEIAVAVHPVTGNLTQLDLLFLSKEGYRPRTWTYERANGDNNLDVTGVEISLTALAESDSATITGVVRRDGRTADQVRVGLGGATANKSGVGIPGQVAITDVQGRYTFSDLPPGTYAIHPGFQRGDGVYFPGQAEATVTLAAGQNQTVPDLLVLGEISPAEAGLLVFSRGLNRLEFLWTPVTGATRYVLSIDGTEFAEVTESYFRGPITGEMPDGRHFWRVHALSETGEVLGLMQRESWFQLVE